MPYSNLKYQSDAGAIYKMRVSEDKEGLAGPEPTGAVTDPNVEVYAGGSGRKRNGIHARGVRVSRTVGTGDSAFKKYAFIPCATPAVQAALLAEAEITYKTLTWQIGSSVAEK